MLQYLNVQLLCLSGKPHPALFNITETREALKFRTHMKLLSGDFPSYELLGNQRGTDPLCCLCSAPIDSTQPPELLNILKKLQPSHGILLDHIVPNDVLTQFLLDPTSINLGSKYRITIQHPKLGELFRFVRDWCYVVTCSRIASKKN